ncbi:reverse transcriptase domain-containing protein [Tanacetum coccineum]
MKVQALKVKVDSKLVACQLNGEFVASSEGIAKYLAKAKELSVPFKRCLIENVPQNQNQKADVLSKLSSVAFNHLMKEVLVEVLNTKSVDTREMNAIVEEEEDNWMTLIIRCLEEVIWPADKNEIMRQGYYWPSMHRDTKEVVDKCDSCQIHASIPRLPKTRLTSVVSPWPFYQWGLDIVGPLPEGLKKLKFIIVAIDYFTMWMKAKPLANTTGKDVKKFVWENIVCRFGLARVIVTDNETQLVNDPFKS